ncbi:hypothetical protein K3N28_16540 [Glycomyces sp. TRM65418]|uniref:hypothetical protein n=1 Tax=Glycomyces sp. TRM65418 TaxID=2867006 RepID=UPI001CE57B7C|nr:hypothetical protein [Glycomyces sp. TRM65418]MCC3764667.1 hypothetical protein [Glycomyces sp. TRM65418]QZD54327.1 hypothetical protein K3N28_16455 [Glycomyces sp. TRM65418]
MTYPPQDSASAGDPYGQPQQGPPPPAGGYAPGQVGGEPYPTSQMPPSGHHPYAGQPDPNQPQGHPGQPQPYPQPGYDPASGYQHPYGQYGPPPVQATTKGGGGTTAFLVIGVVVLMAIGAVTGYFLLGGDDEPGAGAADDDTTSENEAPEEDEEDGEEPTEESAPAPSGTHLEVASLSSITPIPGPEWEYAGGPGAASDPLVDAEIYTFNHTPEWISFFGVGVFSGAAAVFDPADLNASAASAADVWLGDGFASVEGYQMSEIAYTEVEVDGRPGVLAEWRNSWTSAPETEDLWEDTAILVVDVDGVNGFIGIASVSESGEAMYDPAVEALLATDFDAETA